MKVLQLDVSNIEFEPMQPEANVYEQAEKKVTRVDNALTMLIAIESGDTEEQAAKAVNDAVAFAKQQKINKIVIYPFAHLSSNLENPGAALKLLNFMRAVAASSGLEVISAPFGWNKRMSINVKGYPLAEQSREYGSATTGTVRTHKKIDTSLVRKSDWSGLPPTDHRTIGERLNLYSFQEVSPAMVYWHSNGWSIYKELVKFIREIEWMQDYKEISTPAIADVSLWEVSGHLAHYMKDMFVFDSDFGTIGLKPMNCPSTMLIYKSRKWSYKELPFRTAIFDKIYRKELSGVVTGLFRVKELTQDDGHIFAREDQIEEEISLLLQFVKKVYDTFGMKFSAKLSTMPDDHLGDEALWNKATEALKKALESNNISYEIKDKEGAFYGPKIDFDVFDSIGRSWQCATIQLDYQLPMRFKLEYTDENGKQKMPVVIHRAILGSIERFTGIITEHYQGKFPTWLAPVQVRVISISEAYNGYAQQIHEMLRNNFIKSELDISDKTLEYKVRDAQVHGVPYTIIVGKKEMEANSISIRSRDNNKQTLDVKPEEFVEKVLKEIKDRSMTLSY
ncbi:MAG: threonine--tRNA ligase [Candidatus Micrarchaeia archaeon]